MKFYSATLAMCFFVFGSVLAQQKQNDDTFKYPDVLKFNLSQTGEPNSIIFKNSTQIRPSQVDILFNRILKNETFDKILNKYSIPNQEIIKIKIKNTVNI